MRVFERAQLPFLKSVVDYDLIIEIGYAEEQGQPLTFKQLILANVASRTTVSRRLTKLIERGVVLRRKNADDRRSSFLAISSPSLKLFGKYGGMLTSVFKLPFNSDD